MTFYARVIDGVIETVPYEVPAILEGKYDLRSMDPDILASHGIYEVVATARPADTATDTHDRTVELVGGVPTVVWTERPKTQGELDADAARAASLARRTGLQQSISTLRAWSTQAEGVTVTQINAVSVLQSVVDKSAIFYDRFADLLEDRFGTQ